MSKALLNCIVFTVSTLCHHQVLDLDLPPGTSSCLAAADLSHNAISTLRDLSAFTRLVRLNLEANCLAAAAGLAGLSLLQELSLAGNTLECCRGLEGARGWGAGGA